ncbi:hypothetical protein Unana1_03427 [Umbelopsis nana]
MKRNGEHASSCLSCLEKKRSAYRAHGPEKQVENYRRIELAQLPEIVREHCKAIHCRKVEFAVKFKLPPEWTKEPVKKIIQNVLEICELNDGGYSFYLQSVTLRYYREKKQCKRQTTPQEKYDCNGAVQGVVDQTNCMFMFSYRHDMEHRLPKHKAPLRADVLKEIQTARMERKPPPTVEEVRKKFPGCYASKMQIAYWYKITDRTKFKAEEEVLNAIALYKSSFTDQQERHTLDAIVKSTEDYFRARIMGKHLGLIPGYGNNVNVEHSSSPGNQDDESNAGSESVTSEAMTSNNVNVVSSGVIATPIEARSASDDDDDDADSVVTGSGQNCTNYDDKGTSSS